ncbi:MAG: peptidylprolyl isomerase [Verrucomicrobia bacterium]|nr:peptidylprolyl isomerase [Verrucomicrobiota bacterium]
MKQTIALLCVALLVGACNGTGTEPKKTVAAQPQGSPDEVAVIETKFGKIVVEFANEDAPKTVANFKKLAKQGYYNGTTFHRVIPNFMIQGGDPNTKADPHSPRAGSGGPGYTVPAEIKLPNVRGSIACARTGDQVNPKRASSGSQFFINAKDNTSLDRGGYTVFGRVLKGMEVADQIIAQPRNAKDNPDEPIRMEIKIVPRAEAGL